MHNVLTNEEKNNGAQLLFDGNSLNGWLATKDITGWEASEGMIICKGTGSGYLYTEEKFDDYILTLEYKTEPEVNSGIFFRWTDINDPVNTGLEMQILDTYHVKNEELGTHDSGALYDLVAPSVNAVRPTGEWNQVEIRCEGSKIQFSLNGHQVIDVDISQWNVAGQNPDGSKNKFAYAWSDQPRLGHIGFQDHGGVALFRNIKIVTL